ncbi:MAG: DUF1893 domain-containing protein [Chitinispirillales bacterium]|nr:DUF1893 domain-containing protein [Chitinispirillales bacterium]
MSDIEKAKSILKEGGYGCVFCKDDLVYSKTGIGVSPIMELLNTQTNLSGLCVADKVVGKAAAMLFALAEVKEVYGEVMSKQAENCLNQHNIKYSYGEIVDAIMNRKGTGICPMEMAVKDIDEPKAAFEAIKIARARLAQSVSK